MYVVQQGVVARQATPTKRRLAPSETSAENDHREAFSWPSIGITLLTLFRISKLELPRLEARSLRYAHRLTPAFFGSKQPRFFACSVDSLPCRLQHLYTTDDTET